MCIEITLYSIIEHFAPVKPLIRGNRSDFGCTLFYSTCTCV